MSYNGHEKTPHSMYSARVAIHFPIHLKYNNHNGLNIFEGSSPYGISTSDRITKVLLRQHKPIICKANPIKTALKYQQLYEQLGSMSTVAKELGVSRVRVHQMLNLLKLDERIIHHLKTSKDQKEINYWTERKLRSLLKNSIKSQHTKFNNKLVK